MWRSAPPFLLFQKRSSCCNLTAEGFFGPGVLLTLCRQSRHMLIKLFCGPSSLLTAGQSCGKDMWLLRCQKKN